MSVIRETKAEKLSYLERQIANAIAEIKELQSQPCKYETYLNTGFGEDLLYDYHLSTRGIWEIYKVSGDYQEPLVLLTTVIGQLDEAIKYAVELKDFWNNESGGILRKILPKGMIELY